MWCGDREEAPAGAGGLRSHRGDGVGRRRRRSRAAPRRGVRRAARLEPGRRHPAARRHRPDRRAAPPACAARRRRAEGRPALLRREAAGDDDGRGRADAGGGAGERPADRRRPRAPSALVVQVRAGRPAAGADRRGPVVRLPRGRRLQLAGGHRHDVPQDDRRRRPLRHRRTHARHAAGVAGRLRPRHLHRGQPRRRRRQLPAGPRAEERRAGRHRAEPDAQPAQHVPHSWRARRDRNRCRPAGPGRGSHRGPRAVGDAVGAGPRGAAPARPDPHPAGRVRRGRDDGHRLPAVRRAHAGIDPPLRRLQAVHPARCRCRARSSGPHSTSRRSTAR